MTLKNNKLVVFRSNDDFSRDNYVLYFTIILVGVSGTPTDNVRQSFRQIDVVHFRLRQQTDWLNESWEQNKNNNNDKFNINPRYSRSLLTTHCKWHNTFCKLYILRLILPHIVRISCARLFLDLAGLVNGGVFSSKKWDSRERCYSYVINCLYLSLTCATQINLMYICAF